MKDATDRSEPVFPEMWDLILFTAGKGAAMQRIRGHLERMLEEHLAGRYRIQVIDIRESPEQAHAFDVVATPTLLRRCPEPRRRIIGDLSLTHKVLPALGIPILNPES